MFLKDDVNHLGFQFTPGPFSNRLVRTSRFLLGNCGNGGKKKGARNRLSEAFFADLYEDWKSHGIQAIEEVRERRPWEYLKICAMIVRGASDFNAPLVYTTTPLQNLSRSAVSRLF
jgi:hypothetical protein